MNRDEIEKWSRNGKLTSLDIHFGKFMMELDGKAGNELFLASALLSHRQREGHICLSLPEISEKKWISFFEGDGDIDLPSISLSEWRKIIVNSKVVGSPDTDRPAPMILDEQNRLYLFKYWKYQEDIAQYIRNRSKNSEKNFDRAKLKTALSRLFPENSLRGEKKKSTGGKSRRLQPQQGSSASSREVREPVKPRLSQKSSPC